jgi:hypothetical protein
MAKLKLPILGMDTARFECVYPSCGGICCKNGRPGLEEGEAAKLSKNLRRFEPLLRPEAQRAVRAQGFMSARKKEGRPMLRVVGGWCVFFNEGCVLHKVGAAEGDRYAYKPWRCAVFPIDQKDDGAWYVRQHGINGEAWDLFCLSPDESPRRASETLAEEAALVRGMEAGNQRWRKKR